MDIGKYEGLRFIEQVDGKSVIVGEGKRESLVDAVIVSGYVISEETIIKLQDQLNESREGVILILNRMVISCAKITDTVTVVAQQLGSQWEQMLIKDVGDPFLVNKTTNPNSKEERRRRNGR